MNDTRTEKLLLIGLAAMSVIILGIIGIMAIRGGAIDANSAGMIGVIVTGLIAFAKDIVQAIRGYSMSAQLGKVTDQLAASAPSSDPAPTDPDAAGAAKAVAGAAAAKADQIAGEAP